MVQECHSWKLVRPVDTPARHSHLMENLQAALKKDQTLDCLRSDEQLVLQSSITADAGTFAGWHVSYDGIHVSYDGTI